MTIYISGDIDFEMEDVKTYKCGNTLKLFYEQEFEIKKWHIATSDMVLIDLAAEDQIKVACEVTMAHMLGIPIVGLKSLDKRPHPWLREMANAVFYNTDDLRVFVSDHYLC